jgi:hypothetical protein
MVYEKLLKEGYPLTANAREIKNKIRKGPEAAKFPEIIKTRETISNKTAKPSASR